MPFGADCLNYRRERSRVPVGIRAHCFTQSSAALPCPPGALSIQHETTLTEDGIRQLVETGRASVGCFVRCADTYHTELRTLA